MPTGRDDILARLRSTIAAWKAEVLAAQEGLRSRIDESGRQLSRLLDVLSARANQAEELAAAQEELALLRRTLQQSGMTVENAGSGQGPRDLQVTCERVASAVAAWTAEVAQAHEGLTGQVRAASEQLSELLLTLDALHGPTPAAPLPEVLKEHQEAIRALRLQNAELRMEPESLRSEMEALREQHAVLEEQAAGHSQELEARLTAAESEHAELRSALEERAAAIEEAQQSIHALNARQRELDEIVSSAQQQVESLQTQLSAREMEAVTLRAHETQWAAAVERIRELEQQAEERARTQCVTPAFQESCEALSAEWREIQAELAAFREQAQAHLDGLVAIACALADRSSAFEQRAAALEGVEAGNAVLQTALEERDRALREAGDRAAELEEAVRAREAVLEQEIAAKEALQTALAELQAQAADHVEALRVAEEGVHASEAALSGEREVRAALEERHGDLEYRFAALQAEIEAVRASRDTQQQRADALEANLQLGEAEIARLQDGLAAAHREAAPVDAAPDTASLADLNAALEACRAELYERNSLLDELRRTQQRDTAAFTEAQAAAEAQQAALRERDGLIAAMQSRVSALEGQVDALEQQHITDTAMTAELHDALNAMRQSEETRLQALEESKESIAELRRQLAERENAAEPLMTHRRELESLASALRDQHAQSASLADALRAELEAARAKGNADALALSETRSALEAQQSALSDRETALEALRDELESMKRERGRVFVGRAGVDQEEAARRRDQARNQQQQILASELSRGAGVRPLGEILETAGVITGEQLRDALKEQRRDPGELLGAVLVRLELASEEAVMQAVACQLGLPVAVPSAETVERAAAELLGRDVCVWHLCIPLRASPGRIVLAMANPLDETALKKAADLTRRSVTPVIAAPTDILRAIDDVYGVY